MNIIVNENILLVAGPREQARKLMRAIDANRAHLAEFLPWVPQMRKLQDCRKYLRHCRHLQRRGLEFSYNIYEQNQLVGRIGLSRIDPDNQSANIGYWLIREAVGRGIISRSIKALLPFAFEDLKLNRLEIRARPNNSKSRAIPERLGFQFEGILRQAEAINGRFEDLTLYSLLKSDWQAKADTGY